MSASLWFSQTYFAHVLRASARLRADVEDWLQHSLVTAIRILTEPWSAASAAGSCIDAQLVILQQTAGRNDQTRARQL